MIHAAGGRAGMLAAGSAHVPASVQQQEPPRPPGFSLPSRTECDTQPCVGAGTACSTNWSCLFFFFFGGEPDIAKHRFCLGAEGRVPTATASRNGNCVKLLLERKRRKKKRSFHFNKAKVSPLNNRMSSVNTRRPQLSEIEVLR